MLLLWGHMSLGLRLWTKGLEPWQTWAPVRLWASSLDQVLHVELLWVWRITLKKKDVFMFVSVFVGFSFAGMPVFHRRKRRHGEVPRPTAQHVHHAGFTGCGFRTHQHPAGSAGAQVSLLIHSVPVYFMCVLLFQNVRTTNSEHITHPVNRLKIDRLCSTHVSSCRVSYYFDLLFF